MGDVELAAIAVHQEGLVTRPQVRAHLSRKQLETRIANGRMHAVRWGVYRFAGTPATPWQELRAACLAAGPAAVASHRSAAALWALPGVGCELPELTVPWPQWPRLPGVRSHQTNRLPAGHCTVREGVPVTSAARTLADLSSIFAPDHLGRLVDAAIRRGIVTLAQVHVVHADLAVAGRRGLTALQTVLERRPLGYRAGGSAAEVDLLDVLRDAGLPAPVQQHQVVVRDTVYVLDFAYPGLRLGIEYDGFAFHRFASDLDHGAARANALGLAGWTVLHFTAGSSPTAIARDVAAAWERGLRALAPSTV